MNFPLYDNPLELAHHYWTQLLTKGNVAVDATCGNGHDTRILARLAGQVYGWDIQKKALDETGKRVAEFDNVTLHLGCHKRLAHELQSPVKLAVYNLGYLPGGDKAITTRVETTLASVETLGHRVVEGGALCITCYPGHPEGAREEEALLSWARALPQKDWCVVHHRFANRPRSPSLLWIQKIHRPGNSFHKG